MSRQKVTTYSKGGNTYIGSQQRRRRAEEYEREEAIKRLKIRIAAFSLVLAGVAGTLTGVITKAVKNSNNAKNTQEAITMAKEYNELIQQEQTMQKYGRDSDLQELNESIIIYAELKEKSERSADEEKKYKDACTLICENKDLVKNMYTDIIKNKVAQAYGITDSYDIMGMKVKDYVDILFLAYDHNPQVTLPDHTKILEDSMDKELQNAIINARHLIDVDYNTDMDFKDLPVQDIVNTYKNAMSFQLDYKVSVDKDGKLMTSKIYEEDRSTDNGIEKNYYIAYDLGDRDER